MSLIAASNWKSMRVGEITWPWHTIVSKNHPGGLKDTRSTEKYAQMYETDSPNDGYKAVKLYLSKLNHKSSAFFQYPSWNWAPSDPVWYDNKPLSTWQHDEGN